jgi:hypothetical protein
MSRCLSALVLTLILCASLTAPAAESVKPVRMGAGVM